MLTPVDRIKDVIRNYYQPIAPGHSDALEDALVDLVLAFGGCVICYGKGYSTEMFGTHAAADFIGDHESRTPVKIHMSYCQCERGNQLKQLVEGE